MEFIPQTERGQCLLCNKYLERCDNYLDRFDKYCYDCDVCDSPNRHIENMYVVECNQKKYYHVECDMRYEIINKYIECRDDYCTKHKHIYTDYEDGITGYELAYCENCNKDQRNFVFPTDECTQCNPRSFMIYKDNIIEYVYHKENDEEYYFVFDEISTDIIYAVFDLCWNHHGNNCDYCMKNINFIHVESGCVWDLHYSRKTHFNNEIYCNNIIIYEPYYLYETHEQIYSESSDTDESDDWESSNSWEYSESSDDDWNPYILKNGN